MRAWGLTIIFLVVLSALAVGCGGDGPAPTPETPPELTPALTLSLVPTAAARRVSPPRPTLLATPAKEPSLDPTSAAVSAAATSLDRAATAAQGGAKPSATRAVPTGVSTQPAAAEGSTSRANDAILSLELSSAQPAPGRGFTLDVQLEPGGRGISGAQFRLRFPESGVEVQDIVLGDLLGPAPLEMKRTGEGPGDLMYAAARRGKTPPVTPGGQLATVRLRVAEETPPGSSLRLWLEGVLIADHGVRRVNDLFVGKALELAVAAAP